ncbi:paramyosin isoform X2 [Cynara cardunculus var. scolymus]|uniref:paramyosin isoform X2 n=1 Tax=Cynara cardunculus var. scolymus TaxID=59895 RepID=UPI000D6259FF|nr:paramyosin isoform X2 [Cynara cardunculus var. scolymus]
MDEELEDRAALLSRIELLERERDELRNDIEQMCMQHAGPSYAGVATRMHFQRTAGLEQEIADLKKKLTACLRENVNLQEELSESYRIKNQLADLHAAELSKSMEAEKQIKFFQGCVATAFSERDNAMMEVASVIEITAIGALRVRKVLPELKAEKAKEKEELASQKFDIMQERIEELRLVVLEEKKLSAMLQTDLEKLRKENEIFKEVITKFYDIRQHSLNEYYDIGWEDRCSSLLNDSEDMWTFAGQGESPTTDYITSLEEEVEALRISIINLRSKLQMGMEIEKHLKKMVRDLKNKNICLEEKMKKDISGLHSFHSQHRLDIVNLLEEESSQFKSVVNDINEKMRQLCMNEELNHLLPKRDVQLPDVDCRDVHISPDANSDGITKENVSGLPSTSISGAGNGSESFAQMLKEKENVSVLQETCSSGTENASEPLAQALQEKVAALLLLSQEEERYLLESNVNAALQTKLEELQKNLIQVTNEKVVALMELAQLKQDYYLLQEKLNDNVKQGKVLIDSEEKSTIHDKDGRLKSLLKKTYFSQWINHPLSSHGSESGAHQEYAHNISKKSASNTMDFARMKIEYAALKESLESMGHLTNSIHRLRLSLVKVKESDAVGGEPEIIENVVTEAKLLKTALGSSLPVSWSAETEDVEKVDFVSVAGFEMVELLILASQLLRNSMP